MMEEFLELPWGIPGAKDENSCFINDNALKTYSSTYKILHDKLQQIFSDDSLSEKDDDTDNQGKARNGGSDTIHGIIPFRNKKQMSKKPNVQTRYVHGQYIPCFSDEAKLKYPKESSLNATQQATYLQLMMKYAKKCSVQTPVEEKELQQYGLLHNKVLAERFEFVHFVKQRCALTQDRYYLINPDVKKYIEEVWQQRLSRVSKCPPLYEPLRMLSLVYADNRRPAILKMTKKLYETGTSPYIVLPKFRTAVNVCTDYSEIRKRFPPELDVRRNEQKVPVSQDKLAESFAVANGVHVVISSSGLKHIVDNHPPNYEKTWDLPVIVKEYRLHENKVCRVVYVDKALPPRCLTTVEKNIWFHKFGVKSLICRRRCREFFESETNSLSIKDLEFVSNKEGCESEVVDDTRQKLGSVAVETNVEDIESDCTTGKCTDAPMKRNCSDSECESHVSTDDDDRLVVDVSDDEGRSSEKRTAVRKVRKSISHNLSQNNDKDFRVTRSRARLLADMCVDQNVGEKATQSVASDNREMDSVSSCRAAPKVTDSIGSEKSVENVTPSTSCTGVPGTAACSEGNSAGSYRFNIHTGNEESLVSKRSSAQKKTEEEQTKIKMTGLNLPNSGFNISYQLWKLCKDEGRSEDRKECFLKGENPNREINVLVRCKVDGDKRENNKNQSCCVVPKMEYMPEYGAQCLTQSEVTRQWISMYVRPQATLCRVRVNACTSEVMMIEQLSLQEVTQELVQMGRPSSMVLGTLYNVLLGLVDLEVGSYLLSHTPKLGAFVNVRQSVSDGRFNLHDMYRIDTKATAPSDGSLWIPVDHKVVTPFHQACNRVPGTFPPKCFVRGKRCSKKGSGKKDKKKNKHLSGVPVSKNDVPHM